MNYREAVRYLDSFIDYEKIGYKSPGIFKLERMLQMAQEFGNPQNSFPSVHITGTKGKGSIAAFVASMLKEAGFRVGLYTSPHLVEPRERIKLDGRMISEDEFAFYASKIKEKFKRGNWNFSPTFFEVYTLLAFDYFKEKTIDYGVIEVGLGGRLDATNIINPLVSVISPISYDHMHILGNRLEEIAFEKSGIIEKGCICVSTPQEDVVLNVIKEKCKLLDVPLILVEKDISFEERYHDSEKEVFDIQGKSRRYKHCISRLLGRHQIVNAVCAVAAIESMKNSKVAKITTESIKRGIEKTKNPGRCEVIAKKPYIILDGAQNKASARALAETIKRNFNYRRLVLVLGISKGKDIKGMVEEITPLANVVLLTKAKIKRAEEPRSIIKFIEGNNIIVVGSVREALSRALALANTEDLILVTGSFFVIGEAKEIKIEKERLAI